MAICPCFGPKDPQKKKADVIKRLNIIRLGGKVFYPMELKPGQIIDYSETFGPRDPIHKITFNYLFTESAIIDASYF